MNASFRLEIPRRGPVCIVCENSLSVGMSYHSILTENEKNQLVRQDFCPACWKKEKGREALSAWNSRVPKKAEKQKPLNRNERALELLKDCLAKEAESEREEAFVLALFLARNRFIASRKDLPGNRGLYEVLSTEEMLAVPKLKLSSLEVDKIQQRLAKKFADEQSSEAS